MKTILLLTVLALTLASCDDDSSNNTNNVNNTNNTNNINNTNNTNNTNNVNAICGDGVLEGNEVCDDGNLNPDDGCSSVCTVEPGWECTTASPSVCVTTCGNGTVDADEACDDGNNDSEDGCDASCSVELGWSCTTESPSVCTAGCGDGLLLEVEGCDDGNNDANDGCSPFCEVETGWTCDDSEPQICTPVCGDDLIVGDETCDGSNLGGSDCLTIDQGFTGGTLSCTETCTFDLAMCEATCPATPVSSTHDVITGDICTVGSSLYFPYIGFDGPEVVYSVDMANNDVLTATFDSDVDGVLFLLDDCFDFDAQNALDFVDTNTATPFTEVLSYTHHGGAGTVYIVADSGDNDCSSPVNFTLTIDVQ
ncbi:DUF4215 domain-containing protein [Myxococcota bacterium]|nr:DUF4215 domain-containing protein [Myxococcota bacterium]